MVSESSESHHHRRERMAAPAVDSSFPLLTTKRGEEEKEEGRGSWWEDTWREVRLVWYIAGPAILTSVFQFSLGSVTQTLVGHIGTLELAAVGIQNLVIAGIGFGVMVNFFLIFPSPATLSLSLSSRFYGDDLVSSSWTKLFSRAIFKTN